MSKCFPLYPRKQLAEACATQRIVMLIKRVVLRDAFGRMPIRKWRIIARTPPALR